MGWAINNLTAPDNYTAASTRDNMPAVKRVNIDVVNAAIFWKVKRIKTAGATGVEGMATFDDEVFMLPGSRTLQRDGIVGFAFRAAVAAANLPTGATQAQVTIEGID